MDANDFILIDTDRFTRRSLRRWETQTPHLNPMYEITPGLRCDYLRVPFVHQVDVQFYALRGRFLFEIAGQDYMIPEAMCFRILAGQPYRFRVLDRLRSTLHLQAPSVIEQDWEIVAEQIRAAALSRRR